MTGVILVLAGLILIASPFADMLRKFGRLDDEVFARWLFGLPLEQLFRVQTAVMVGIAMLQFGLFLIVRPR